MFRNYFRQTPERKPRNLIRILEWILCTICLGLAIYVLLQLRRIYVVLKSILILVAGAYFFITIVDITVTSLLRPLLWTSWVMFALMGALAFFLCTGLLMFRLPPFGMALYIGIFIANGITGLVFLLESLYIICWLINNNDPVEFNKGRTSSQTTSPASTTSTDKNTKRSDKTNQFPENGLLFRGNDISVQYPSDTSLRREKITCAKETYPKKYCSVEVPSHGGTFHVSKDVAPILSPSPFPISRCGYCREKKTSVNQQQFSSEPETLVLTSQKDRDHYGNLIEEALTVKCRTVSTSARTIPKQNHETTYTVTVKNDPCNLPMSKSVQVKTICDEKQLTKQNTATVCRPHSSPAGSQISTLSSAARNYSTCSNCGGTHPYSSAVQSMSNRETCNSYRSKRLPTVQEYSCYESTDEPTKDCSYGPCPSPTTPTSSNKLSPSSCTSTNRNASRVSSNYTSPRCGSPCVDGSMVSLACSDISESYSYSTQPSCASSLPNKTKTSPEWCCAELLPSVYQSPKSSYCHTATVSAAKKENHQKCRPRSIGAAAVFRFQPYCKNEEIQTRSYKLEKRDGSCSTSSKDHRRVSINPQICFGPDYYSNENNCAPLENSKSHNRESNCCLFEMPRLQLNPLQTETNTVLPGTADPSPRNEIGTEEYKIADQKLQQTTVIDVKNDASNVSIGYLVPTQCNEKQESTMNSKERHMELHNRQPKCTII